VFLYYYDKKLNQFKFMKVLIIETEDQSLSNNNNNEVGLSSSSSSPSDGASTVIERPFPEYCLSINGPWSVKVNVVNEQTKADAVSASTTAANSAAAAAAHVGEVEKPPRPMPMSTLLTLTDKLHRIHSFMVNIVPNELIVKDKPNGEEGGVVEGREKKNDVDEEDDALKEGPNQRAQPKREGPYANHTVTTYHLSSYGINHEDSGSAGNKGTLDIPSSSCILRMKEAFPIANPNPIIPLNKKAAQVGDDENEAEAKEGSGENPEEGSDSQVPAFSEYVIVVDSHNHGIVALGVNVP
jgi:hypothetical protein